MINFMLSNYCEGEIPTSITFQEALFIALAAISMNLNSSLRGCTNRGELLGNPLVALGPDDSVAPSCAC